MRRAGVLAGAAALALLFGGGGAVAQTTDLQILIVDRDRALSESEPARRIAESEQAERLALRSLNQQLQIELETEEAEIAAMREASSKEQFEERVRAFNIRVRNARQTSQTNIEAFRRRFEDARRGLSDMLPPILQQILQERGASLILDAATVLAAKPGADVTEEVIRRLNEAAPSEAQAPQPDQ